MSRPIDVGDIVNINFNDAEAVSILENAKIVHAPQDTGDWWYVEYFRQDTGEKITMGINPMASSVESMVKHEKYQE